jgi:DNA-binding transcriptional regulator YdaS (Cro superfamily)
MNKQRFLDYLAVLVRAAGSQKAAARTWGVSGAYLGDVLKGRREPGPTLLQALGIWKEVEYVEVALDKVPGE